MDTRIDKIDISERNERAHAYSVRCCRRRARTIRRRNERNARIQRSLSAVAIVIAAVICGVLLEGV